MLEVWLVLLEILKRINDSQAADILIGWRQLGFTFTAALVYTLRSLKRIDSHEKENDQ